MIFIVPLFFSSCPQSRSGFPEGAIASQPHQYHLQTIFATNLQRHHLFPLFSLSLWNHGGPVFWRDDEPLCAEGKKSVLETKAPNEALFFCLHCFQEAKIGSPVAP